MWLLLNVFCFCKLFWDLSLHCGTHLGLFYIIRLTGCKGEQQRHDRCPICTVPAVTTISTSLWDTYNMANMTEGSNSRFYLLFMNANEKRPCRAYKKTSDGAILKSLNGVGLHWNAQLPLFNSLSISKCMDLPKQFLYTEASNFESSFPNGLYGLKWDYVLFPYRHQYGQSQCASGSKFILLLGGLGIITSLLGRLSSLRLMNSPPSNPHNSRLLKNSPLSPLRECQGSKRFSCTAINQVGRFYLWSGRKQSRYHWRGENGDADGTEVGGDRDTLLERSQNERETQQSVCHTYFKERLWLAVRSPPWKPGCLWLRGKSWPCSSRWSAKLVKTS